MGSLNEVHDVNSNQFTIIMDWIEKQPHLPKNFDASFIVAYLKQCKSIEIAKKKLDNFCRYRTIYPVLFEFANRDVFDPAFSKACTNSNMFFLPERTPEGYVVFVITGCLLETYDCLRACARILALGEIALNMWPDCPGNIFVLDVFGSDFSFALKVDIQVILTVVNYAMDALSFKLKKAVVINSNKVTEYAVNLLKPVISKKVKSRMDITSQDERYLEKIFPLELLPCDMTGGKAPPKNQLNEKWLRIMEDRRDWLKKYSSLFCSNEEKRPPDSRDSESVEGSFRYLNID